MKKDTAITLAVAVFAAGCLFASCSSKAEEPVVVVNDFMCGLHHVMIRDDGGLMVNEQPYGEYKTTLLTEDNSYVHQFGEKAELRVSQLGRIAFRLAGETRWAKCKPLVFYTDSQQAPK